MLLGHVNYGGYTILVRDISYSRIEIKVFEVSIYNQSDGDKVFNFNALTVASALEDAITYIRSYSDVETEEVLVDGYHSVQVEFDILKNAIESLDS